MSATTTKLRPATTPPPPGPRVQQRRAKALHAKLRLYGIVFLAVIALLLGLSVAAYKQAFTPVVDVTLQAGSVGNQLDAPADVKLNGLIVGEVRNVSADGDKATVNLALDPQYVNRIPNNVDARLLPKTLFGEKYVDLVIPKTASQRHIQAGDVITQDHTKLGIELQQLMSDLLPLLRTVQPGKLNATLSAFATALDGRGDEIGANLARVERYFHELNPHMPQMQQDISKLADVANLYGDAAPDILRILRNSITTSKTLVEQRNALASVLTGTTKFADTGTKVIGDNSARLITLGQVSRPILAMLARYSPEYPCLLNGFAKNEPRLEKVFQKGRFHITLEVNRPRPPYHPGEEPQYADHRGPNCQGLPHPPVPAPSVKLNDGTDAGGGGGASATPGGQNISATQQEQHLVGSLVAPVMGVSADEVPSVATLLFGPMARGTAVNVA